MQALNAFRNADFGAGDRIPSALVPDLSKLKGSRNLSEGTSVLFRWLQQQGLNNEQIMAYTPAEWSAIKIAQLDKGLNIAGLLGSVRDTVVGAIPKTRAQWIQVATDYFVPGGRKAANAAKRAWRAFKEENWVQETGQGLDELLTKDIDIGVFDKFMKAYTQQSQSTDKLNSMKDLIRRAKSEDDVQFDLNLAVVKMRSAPGVYLRALRDAAKNESPGVGWVKKNVRQYLLGEVQMMPMGTAKTAVLGKMLKSSPGNASVQGAVSEYLEEYDAQPPREFAPPRDSRVLEPPAPGEPWPTLPPRPEDRVSGIEGLMDPTSARATSLADLMDPDWRPAPPPRPISRAGFPTTNRYPDAARPAPAAPAPDPAIAAMHERFNAEFHTEPSMMSRVGTKVQGWFQPKQHDSLVSWQSGAKQIGIRREDMAVHESPDLIMARDARVEEDWAARRAGVRQDPFVNRAPWQEEDAPSTLEMMQAYSDDPEPTMVEELREASLDPYDYFDDGNRLEALVEEWRTDLEPQAFQYRPKSEVEKVEDFMLSEFGPDADAQELEETAAFVRDEFGETRGEELMRQYRERKAAKVAETIAPGPSQEPNVEVQLNQDINTPIQQYYDRVAGDMLLAETQSQRTPNQELLADVDSYLETLRDSELKGMSLTQRLAWETKEAGVSQSKNAQLLSEVDSFLGTIDEVQDVNWESDSVYHEFVQKWAEGETPGAIKPAPEEYTTPGGKPWNVGEMKTTKVNVEGIKVFDEAGITELELSGVDPASVDKTKIAAAWEDLGASGKAGFMFKQIFTKAGAKYMAEFSVATLAMMGLQSAIHDDNAWIILSAATAPVVGWATAGIAIASSAASLGADYIRRQIAWQYSDDSVLNKVCYIRSGGKWVPAIIRSKGEPTEAATFLDAKGLDENWTHAVTLTVETGFGLTTDDSGNLEWLKAGRKDRVIMRQPDIDWHGNTSLRDVENWKPWTNVYFPDSEDGQRDMIQTGLTEGIDARRMDEVFAELDSSDRFRAMVELSHMLFDQHVVDPSYKSKYVQSSGGIGWDAERQVNVYNNPSHWEDDHPEMFDKFERHDYMPSGRQSGFWRNINAGDNIAFYAEIHNPDNKQQYGLQHKRETGIDEIVSYLSADIDKLYGNLSDETREELRLHGTEAVPDRAILFNEYVTNLGKGALSPEAKEFRIAQAQLQFTIMQASKYFADPKGAARGSDLTAGQAAYLTDRIAQPMYDQYKQSLQHIMDVHTEEAIADMKGGEHGFLLFGGYRAPYGATETWNNTNAWGIQDIVSSVKDTGPIQRHGVIRRALPDHGFTRAFLRPSLDKASPIIPMSTAHKMVSPTENQVRAE